MTFGHTAPSRVSSGWSSRKRTWWWAQSYVSHFQSLPCPDEFLVPQCKHFDLGVLCRLDIPFRLDDTLQERHVYKSTTPKHMFSPFNS